MAENFYTILTNVGKAKIANATALGTKVNFSTLKVGDSNGAYYNPTESQEDLVHTVWQGNINSIRMDEKNPNWMIIEVVIPADNGGFIIREVGIYDNDMALLAIGKYPETYKPMVTDGSTKDITIRMILEVSNSASVTLKVDPTVTLATQKDIENLQSEIANIKVPVKTVNTKTGDVVLKANDIKTEDETTLEQVKENFDTHLAENATLTTKGHVQLGTTSTTAAVGNHNHSGVYEPILAVERKRKITFGTTDPTGGVDGDIYLQYTYVVI